MSIASISTVPGARPVVELGVGDTRVAVGQARWDIARWDTAPGATWAGGEPTWLDITCDVHDIEVNIGRERSIDRWQVATATVTLDNTTGWADVNTPPEDPLALSVHPGRALRVGIALDDAPVTWLWRGFVDAAEPRYDPTLHDTVVLDCVDAKGWTGKVDLAAVDPPVTAETTSARINRILDAAAWRVGHRDIAASSIMLVASDLGAKAVDLMDIAADSAGGAVFGDTRGYVVFRSRDWQTFPPDTPPDATIGNVAAGDVPNDIVYDGDHVVDSGDQLIFGVTTSAGDVCPSGWELSFELADVATRVIVARTGQPGRVFNDPVNQVLYGVETFTRSDLECETDSQVDLLGTRYLQVLSADYMPNVGAVTLDAATTVAARDLCATVDPTRPSHYRCRLVEDRVVFDREFFATGVQHRIDPTSWTCRISLDDAAPYEAVGGRWDGAYWDRSLWSGAVALLAEARQLIGAGT